jgi:hypothetical protein
VRLSGFPATWRVDDVSRWACRQSDARVVERARKAAEIKP